MNKNFLLPSANDFSRPPAPLLHAAATGDNAKCSNLP